MKTKYCFKQIKEKQLAEFLLNPFETSFYIEDKLIQKFSIYPNIDDFFISNENSNHYHKAGHILYEIGEIWLGNDYFLSKRSLESGSFKTTTQIRKAFLERLKIEIEKEQKIRLPKIIAEEKYKKMAEYSKERHFKTIVYHMLGTIKPTWDPETRLERDITRYAMSIESDDFVKAYNKELDIVKPFIENLFESYFFLAANIVLPKLLEEANEYITIGKFTDRELVLIAFIESMSLINTQLIDVELEDGRKIVCCKDVDCEGILISPEMKNNKIDIEQVKQAKLYNNVIYTKRSL